MSATSTLTVGSISPLVIAEGRAPPVPSHRVRAAAAAMSAATIHQRHRGGIQSRHSLAVSTGGNYGQCTAGHPRPRDYVRHECLLRRIGVPRSWHSRVGGSQSTGERAADDSRVCAVLMRFGYGYVFYSGLSAGGRVTLTLPEDDCWFMLSTSPAFPAASRCPRCASSVRSATLCC
jgi:hypothetical protein